MGKSWSQEELDYLEENWGRTSIKSMAKRLNRSLNAVKLKAYRIGFSDAREHYDGLTVNQLASALNTHYSTIKNWICKYSLPVKSKIFCEKSRVNVIRIEDWWKWANANKEMVDFSRLDRGLLGPEPDWVEVKRNADKMRKVFIPKPHNTPWSKEDVGLLKSMVSNGSYSYPEISSHLKRTQGAIKRKLMDLGIKYRPNRLDNHRKYTEEEVEYLVKALEEGRSFEEIATKLNRSSLGVRGKAERMGYTFTNGVPIKREIV